MEMISSAAAKMTKSANACEMTGAEIWMSAKTAIELFGASVLIFANTSTSYNIDSSLTDFFAKRGQFCDRRPRERLEQCNKIRTSVAILAQPFRLR